MWLSTFTFCYQVWKKCYNNWEETLSIEKTAHKLTKWQIRWFLDDTRETTPTKKRHAQLHGGMKTDWRSERKKISEVTRAFSFSCELSQRLVSNHLRYRQLLCTKKANFRQTNPWKTLGPETGLKKNPCRKEVYKIVQVSKKWETLAYSPLST